MNQQLQQALERIGWDELYERLLPDLRPPNGRGERICRSPLPDINDHNPSFSVNVNSGLWRCFASSRGGNYVQLLAWLRFCEPGSDGELEPNFRAAERALMEEYGLARPITSEWVADRCQALMGSPDLIHRLQLVKPWVVPALRLLNIGYDAESNRLVFPCYDRQGKPINARLYLPGGQPKFIWAVAGITDNFLYPRQAWNEGTIVLVEGEPDAVSLRSYGFAGTTGTMGSGQPVPTGGWERNKHVYVWMDADAPGQEATEEAIRQLLPLAASVHRVRWPEWEGRPDNADVSDFIQHLVHQGFDQAAIQRRLSQLFETAELIENPATAYDVPPIVVPFSQTTSASLVAQRLQFSARVAAKGEQHYLLPIRYEVTCPAGAHPNLCPRCPMRTTFNGRGTFEHDPRDARTLRLIQVSQGEQTATVKDAVGIPSACPSVNVVVHDLINAEPIMLSAAPVETEEGEPAIAEHLRQAGFALLDEDERVEENRDYTFSGFVYPHPKTQSAVFVLDTLEPLATGYERFRLTPELAARLSTFQPRPGVPILAHLTAEADDLAAAVTQIWGRTDLHLAYRTIYHSVLSFKLGGMPIGRGWLECLVVGDTRCGKSVAFRKLSEHYQVGLLVDCKMQTPAGILGSVVTNEATGERFVVPGVYPQQDGRIICFDEFHAPRWERGASMLEYLASTRSEGMVRISKAASAQFHARVRTIWLANPGAGELISELATHGIELLRKLCGQPENVARFDLALAVAKQDVPTSVVNQAHQPKVPRHEPELARALLAWTWSRRPDQVTFTTQAVEAVLTTAEELFNRYDDSIPLVESSDQRTRVAKVAVSVAAQCYSTEDGDALLVKPEHVLAAYQMFRMWYDKDVMGYDQYSDRIRRDRSIEDAEAVRKVFDETIAPNGRVVAKQLMSLEQFSERIFATFLPNGGILTRGVLQILVANRCVRPVNRGKSDSFELTPPFIAWLKTYLSCGQQ